MIDGRVPFKPYRPLDERLEEFAECLREEARGLPPGIERKQRLRKAQLAEQTASNVNQWLNSPGWQPLK